MEARLLRAALVVAAVCSLGAGRPYASVRSPNFIVSAPTRELAQEICQAAEAFRRDLAIEWLGQELPQWQGPCPVRADVAKNLGAGGATSFVFRGGMPTEWTMQIQGSRERILDSVLPHEVTHTIFATHFGGPLPRWADEGACTTVEHASERAKQDKFLIQFLTPDERGQTRGIPFNQMFRMKQYPKDILPLYSQGYSLAKFFIQQGGKRKFVDYVGEGMQTNNWPAVTQKYYGFSNLSELQLTWVEWVRKGSPQLAAGTTPVSTPAAAGGRDAGVGMTQLASLSRTQQSRVPNGALASWQTPQSQNARAFSQADQYETPPAPTNFPEGEDRASANPRAGDYSQVSRPVSDGWYARKRDQAQAVINQAPGSEPAEPAALQAGSPEVPASPVKRPAAVEAQPLTPLPHNKPAADGSDRRVLLEWTRPADHPYGKGGELSGVALAEVGAIRR